MLRLRRLACLLILSIPWLLHAQSGPRFESGFERDINRYRWLAGVHLDESYANWRLQAVNRFRSDAFILFNNQLNFRDQNRLIWSMQKMTGALSPGLEGHVDWYSQSRVFNQETYGVLRYSPKPAWLIQPMAGVALDQRPGAQSETGTAPLRTDAGPAFGGKIAWRPPSQQAYRFTFEADGRRQRIQPRRGHGLRIRSSVDRVVEQTRFSSSLGYSSYRRDTYQAVSFLNRDAGTPRSESIEATTSDTLFADLNLEMPFFKGIRFVSQVNFQLNNRIIRTSRVPDESLAFDTDFNRRAVDAEVGLQYDVPRLSSRIVLATGAEAEQRQLANREDLPPSQAAQKGDLLLQADYDRSLFALRTQNRAHLGQRTTLNLEFSASILRHDTPDINLDDRDEAYYNGRFGIRYQISPTLAADLHALGTYYHTVYLKASRSAENNVQRSLRFRPVIFWQPDPQTRLRLESEVRATYTVDDFILPGRRPTDQSARELRYQGEFETNLRDGLRLMAEGTFSDLRLGRFFQDAFAEIPFDTLRTYSGWIRLQTGRNLRADIGFRLFIRTDFDRFASVRYRAIDEAGAFLRDETGAIIERSVNTPSLRWIEQLGPTSSIVWPLPRGGEVRFEGWLNIQHIRYRLYGISERDDAAHLRREAWHGTRRIFPNMSVNVVWGI